MATKHIARFFVAYTNKDNGKRFTWGFYTYQAAQDFADSMTEKAFATDIELTEKL